MTEIHDKTNRSIVFALIVAGVLLGVGLRMTEPRAHASSAECPDDGEREGQFVAVRRIEGSGPMAQQEYWRSYVTLLLRSNLLTVFEIVADPKRPPFELEIAPEATP